MTSEERRALVAATIEAEIKRQLRPRFRTLRSIDELAQVRADVAAIVLEVLVQLGAQDLGPVAVEIGDPIVGGKLHGHCPVRYIGPPWGDFLIDLE